MSATVGKNSDMRSRVLVAIPLLCVAVLALLEPGVWLTLMLLVGFLAMKEVEGLPGGRGGIAGWSAIGLLAMIAGGLVASALTRLGHYGLYWVAFIGVIVIVNDTGALLIGRAIGERPFFPSISPNKTVEGALGGILVGFLSGVVMMRLAKQCDWSINYAAAFALSVVVPLVAVAGDLFESKVKRLHGVKDMGHLLPGHGGVADRVDALSACWLVGSIILAATASL